MPSPLPSRCRAVGAALCLLLVAGPAMQADAQADTQTDDQVPRFVQDRFAIGFWVDPPVDDRAEARYAEIAAAHFNLVLALFGAPTPAQQVRVLELAAANDLRAILPAGTGPAADLPDGPACWGYSLRDEPPTADFPSLRTRVDALRLARPGRLAYINLFPGYATAQQLGAPSFARYLRQFADVVDPDVLSLDHYPRFGPAVDGVPVDGRDGYCADLAALRVEALRLGVPFWNFFNTMPYGPHTDPTEAQLRWQVFASLAHGARGILYFCYFTPPGAEFPKGGAIIRRDGSRTRHYDQARRLNRTVAHLGPTLMRLTSTAVLRIRPGDDAAAVLAGSPLRSLVRADVDPPGDYLVGVFRHDDGRRAVLLQNYRFAYTAWPTVGFDADPARVVEVSHETGEEVPLRDDSPDMPGGQVSLDAGEGRLFLLPAE